MSDPVLSENCWTHEEVGGFIRSASAVIDLGHPRSNPRGPSTTLFLEVEEDEDLVEYVWSFGISEEEAGFGEAEFGSGWSPDLQQAEDDCWEAVVIFLRGEGYSADEITQSVSSGEGDRHE